LDVSDEFVERRIGVGAAWTFKEILESKGLTPASRSIKRLVEAKIRTALKNSDDLKLFLCAIELLESLQGKVKMGLASMNNRKVIDFLLKALDVDKFFSVVVTGDDVNKSKPDPEIFLKTAQKLGSKPEACVVLEDSIFGVKAAKAGNMGCVAVAQGAYSVAELGKANPDLIVNSLQEKEQIVKFILE
jgi:HAD superfamily hydrolase (TIGR01509 family)